MRNKIKLFCLGVTRVDYTPINQKHHCAGIRLTGDSQRTLPQPVKAGSLNVNKIAYEVPKHGQISIFAVKHRTMRQKREKKREKTPVYQEII